MEWVWVGLGRVGEEEDELLSSSSSSSSSRKNRESKEKRSVEIGLHSLKGPAHKRRSSLSSS